MSAELTRAPARMLVAASFVLLATSASAAPKHAGNTTKARCIAAHEAGQELRGDKKPHAAREKFVQCARSECPLVLRKECTELLAAVDKDAPTVALEAKDDAGNDTADVKVTMDGEVVAVHLTGTALDVEPGEHVFTFEREDGKKIEQRVLVVEGDKNKKVVADYSSLVPKPPPSPVPGREPRPSPPPERKPIPVLSWVAGGVAAAALGSFAFFAISGKGDEHDLAGSCSPRCTDAEVAPVKRDYLVADVSLGVAVVAAAVAVVLALPSLGSSARVEPARAAPPPWLPRVRRLR